MNFMVHIKMMWFFLSSNLSLPYKIKVEIKLYKKELQMSGSNLFYL